MTDIPDIISHEPMREPTPPLCKHCHVELAIQHDRRTGKPVRHRGRAMLRCPVCGEMVIGADYRAARRRFRVVAWIGGLATALVLAGEIGIGVARAGARTAGPNSSGTLWVQLSLAACIGVVVGLALEMLSLALSPGSAVARLYCFLSSLFFAAFAVSALRLLLVAFP